MNAENAFNSAGVDPISGVQLMATLGMSNDDLIIPQRFQKFQEILSFFSKFSEDTQRFLVSKATRGKMVDKLDHIFEYTQLLKQKEGYESELRNLGMENSAVEMHGDSMLMSELSHRAMDIRQRLSNVREEIDIYEK